MTKKLRHVDQKQTIFHNISKQILQAGITDPGSILKKSQLKRRNRTQKPRCRTTNYAFVVFGKSVIFFNFPTTVAVKLLFNHSGCGSSGKKLL
jgi:hypothetical protein